MLLMLEQVFSGSGMFLDEELIYLRRPVLFILTHNIHFKTFGLILLKVLILSHVGP